MTVCTYSRQPHLGDPEAASELSAQIPPIFNEYRFDVTAYCVMPDHVHLLLEGQRDDSDLREAMRRWKLRTGYVWRQHHQMPLWQTSFQDRVLRDHDDTRAVVRYILNNPVRAGLVRHAADYRWSGSSRYSIAELSEHAGDWHPGW